ncbi:ABC transporter substrate-binding protein [Nocardioides sp. L-11A]|uniref:ABC transporter substrate-binding protein n=1 Tax=Nocardioides sp. L-11A TaxID=3043848 RepID=UPI00249BC212|nr:ABC transporter substrate-binding protein [Nocardioides sp. L-11A]
MKRYSSTPRVVRGGSVAALAVTLLLAAGCGSDGSDGGGSSDGTLKVSSLGYCSEIPLWWAEEKGLFDDRGLDVELVEAGGGGSTTIAAAVGGSVDVAFTAPGEVIQAIQGGTPLTWIATAYGFPTDEEAATSGAMVKDGSSIERFSDLEGRTVALTAVGGVSEATVAGAIRADGGDPSSVKWVALPGGQLLQAVLSGKVDVAQTPLPVASMEGLRNIGSPHTLVTGGVSMPFAGYAQTTDFYTSHEKQAEDFYDALTQAGEELNDPANADEMYRIMAERCGQTVEALKQTPMNPIMADVNMPGLEKYVDILVQGKVVREDSLPDLEELVAPFAQSGS